MRKINNFVIALAVGALTLFSCATEETVYHEEAIPQDVLNQLSEAGYDVSNALISYDDNDKKLGYIVENDLLITEEALLDLQSFNGDPETEQYATDNLVTGLPRVITVYMPTGRKGFSSGEQAGLDEALRRYNAENLQISFQRSSSSSADIVFQRLSKRDERRGVLGSAGFPTSGGSPFGTIRMSGILESTYGLSVNGIATIMAHEMGHCIGFRHTDFFDRSISCGGALSNEGNGGVGANHIPGTNTGADLQGNGSWMLACSDGSSRPFTNDDKTALSFLY
ncbi:MAG: M57 family metalloprotease [Cyclobacteriaceae bacterium]